MRAMGLQAVHLRPNTSRPAKGHKVYPYLLGGVGWTLGQATAFGLGVGRCLGHGS